MDPNPLKLDTHVELADQYSDVYPLSPTGARGWVRARRELPKTDPEVWIEWDKTHWRYHGERDGWTFEHHFRPVLDKLPDRNSCTGPDLSETASMDQILAEAYRKVEEQRCEHCGEIHAEPEEDFINTLMEAQDAAAGSDAYLIVTLRPRTEDGYTVFQPEVFFRSLTESARLMIMAQVASMAAEIFNEGVQSQVNHLEGGTGEPGR